MSEKTISFIVPVYNAEKYLKTCIESIVSQKGSTELILVDDGSTDKSGSICDEYAQAYENVQVYHVPNGGAGKARNLGAGKARGEYLVFVDSDDYLAGDFLQHALQTEAFGRAEVIFFQCVKDYGDGSFVPVAEGLQYGSIHNKSKLEVLRHISECAKFPGATWGKIVKRSFVEQYGIAFPTDVYAEDIDWNLQLLYHAADFEMLCCDGYFYRIVKGSRSSHASGEKSVVGLLKIIHAWAEKLAGQEYEALFMPYLAYEYAMVLHYYGALKKEKRKEYADRVRRWKYLLGYGKTGKLRLIRLAADILGVELTGWLLYKYLCIRDGR